MKLVDMKLGSYFPRDRRFILYETLLFLHQVDKFFVGYFAETFPFLHVCIASIIVYEMK